MFRLLKFRYLLILAIALNLDPCKDTVCGAGLIPVPYWGGCECRCGATIGTAVKIVLPSHVNRCVNNRTVCGSTNAACNGLTHGLTHCLRPDGSTPTVEDTDATCQVTHNCME